MAEQLDPIEKKNWLAHRWPIDLRTHPYGQWTVHVDKVEGHRVGQHTSRVDYDTWLEGMRPVCLARFIAARTGPDPATAIRRDTHDDRRATDR